MGLDYFAKTCSAEPTLTAAMVWCVAKEGTCCAVCPNTLSSVGTRIGLTFTVFFSTAVSVVDGAEAPFIFLTTAVQVIAYVGTVLFYGTAGSGISRFHAYYALFASVGFLCPLAAVSVSAAWYLYGGSHGKIGQKLLDVPADAGQRDRKKHQHKNGATTSHSLGSARMHGRRPSFSFRSLGSSETTQTSVSHRWAPTTRPRFDHTSIQTLSLTQLPSHDPTPEAKAAGIPRLMFSRTNARRPAFLSRSSVAVPIVPPPHHPASPLKTKKRSLSRPFLLPTMITATPHPLYPCTVLNLPGRGFLPVPPLDTTPATPWHPSIQ
ncbi:hypothetical protein JCM11251_002385 [Rhodosporidiobolus azoricus]